MNVQIENIESTSPLRRKLTIELEPQEIRRELDHAYGELRRNVVVKGFRPGRAPQKLLERFFGDQVRGDVIQRLVREYTDKALSENELKPVLAPEIVTEETDLTKTLRFSAVFDVKPEIVIKDYQGLKVPEEPVEVSDEEVQGAIERVRERQATLKKVEDRTVVENGDVVMVEIEGLAEGNPTPLLKIEDRLIEVSETLAHGINEVLVGAEIGNPAVKSKSYDEQYSDSELAGKTVEWHAKVKEIFRRELPALDDEFARDLGEFQNLDELRSRVREDLLDLANREAHAKVRQGLLQLIVDRNPVEVPESLVARELKVLEAELEGTLEASGMTHDQAAAQIQERYDELKTRAEKEAISTLVVDALTDQEQVEVSDDEVADRVGELVTQAGRQRDRIAEFYSAEENRAVLKQSMRRQKVLDLLVSRARTEGDQDSPADAEPS